MAEQDQDDMQDQGEGDVTEAPDYEALYKSSQEIVSMLSGTDDETLTAQAKAVADAIKAAPRYPTVTDEGKPAGSKAMTEEEIEKIKNPRERVMARAAKIAQERRK